MTYSKPPKTILGTNPPTSALSMTQYNVDLRQLV